MQRQRRFLPPQWSGSTFEQWANGFVRKNQWKVAEYLGSHEDAMQECALIYTRCVRRYSATIDSPKWLMALFKRAVSNDWITYGYRASALRDVSDQLPPDEMRGIDFNIGPLMHVLTTCSPELRKAIEFLIHARQETLLAVLQDGQDEKAINRRLIRFARIKGEPNLVGELRELLS